MGGGKERGKGLIIANFLYNIESLIVVAFI